MYAIIKTGGKQYRVEKDQVVRVETIVANEGETIDFTEVLMITSGADVKIGSPMIENAKVTAEVVKHGRGKKIDIIKFKRRKHHMKRMGHRQNFTDVKITQIEG